MTRPDWEKLALFGGKPSHAAPFPPWPYFDEEEIQAATDALGSGRVNYWTGTQGREFEGEFAAYCGVKYAVALANGTVALELALHALGFGPGDEVITTPRTFIASASCAVMRGGRPVFAEVDPQSQNITAETIRPLISKRTRAIIAVHLAGWPCDMDPIMELAQQHGIKVVEDCAQAHGATYKGRPVGSLGHVASFSFCQDKIMSTAGEGGMLTTNSEEVWRRAWEYKDHGKNWEKMSSRVHNSGYRWLHESFGTNWRLTEPQSAIGRVQLRKLDTWVKIRRENADRLGRFLVQFPALRVIEIPPAIGHAYYKYYAFTRSDRLKPEWSRDRIIEAVAAEGIPCFSGSCGEIYLEKAFSDAGLGPKERFPIARELGDTSLMFLVHPTLGEKEMTATQRAIEKVMTVASQL